MLARSRIGIVGLGLMGGSLALALRGHCALLAGLDHDVCSIDKALQRGVIDRGATDLRALRDVAAPLDVLILATPINAMLDLIPELCDYFDTPLHLLDVGSTKTEIVRAMMQLPERIHPIGGHPWCGKEVSGLDGAEVDLFRDQMFTLTPLDRTPRATLELAHELVATIGARAMMIDAERHDRLAAAVSHIPYLTSVALVEAAGCVEDDLVWTLAASGFRDSTRLAVSDLTMMRGILSTNRSAVLQQLACVRDALDQITALIERGDDEQLRAKLDASRHRREGMFR